MYVRSFRTRETYILQNEMSMNIFISGSCNLLCIDPKEKRDRRSGTQRSEGGEEEGKCGEIKEG